MSEDGCQHGPTALGFGPDCAQCAAGVTLAEGVPITSLEIARARAEQEAERERLAARTDALRAEVEYKSRQYVTQRDEIADAEDAEIRQRISAVPQDVLAAAERRYAFDPAFHARADLTVEIVEAAAHTHPADRRVTRLAACVALVLAERPITWVHTWPADYEAADTPTGARLDLLSPRYDVASGTWSDGWGNQEGAT